MTVLAVVENAGIRTVTDKTVASITAGGWEEETVEVPALEPGDTFDVMQSLGIPTRERGKEVVFTVSVPPQPDEEAVENNSVKTAPIAIPAAVVRPSPTPPGGRRSPITAVEPEDEGIPALTLVLVGLGAGGVGLAVGRLLCRRGPTPSLERTVSRPPPGGTLPPLPGTGVADLLDRYLGAEPGPPLWSLGPASRQLRDRMEIVEQVAPLIGTAFWRAWMSSSSGRETLARCGASASAIRYPEVLVVRHAEDTRYDLLVFDPDFSLAEPSGERIVVDEHDVVAAWHGVTHGVTAATRDIEAAGGVLRTGLPMDMLDDAVAEVARAAPVGIVVAPKPVRVPNSCPSPAWPVASEGQEPTSTVGAIVSDRDGRTGVTVAEHAVRGFSSVFVNGRRGIVRSSDPISDSCFVEVDVRDLDATVGAQGPLAGLSPREMEVVTFDGVRSGKSTTRVIGWDPTILTVEPYIQNKIVTEPVTLPGDSGAALVDSSNHILGFAFYTTGLSSHPQHSGWIWAESVFRAHGLVLSRAD